MPPGSSPGHWFGRPRLGGRFATREELERQAYEAQIDDRLLEAARACDTAAAALSEALEARRRALVVLTSRTKLEAAAPVKRALSPSMAWKALWWHGVGDALQLPHSMRQHRQSFEAQARGLIANVRGSRRADPAPAASGELKESA